MEKWSQFLIFAFWGVTFSQSAHAISLKFQNREYIGVAGQGLQAVLDDLADGIETEFNANTITESSERTFLGALSNATAISNKGSLSQLSGTSSRVSLGLYLGAGLALGAGSSLSNGLSVPANSLPPIGFGAALGVTLGVSNSLTKIKLPFLAQDRTMLIASFSTFNSKNNGANGFSLKSTQAGLGFSYQYFNPTSWSPLIRFNGIRLTHGLQMNSISAGYRTPFRLSSSSNGVDMIWDNDMNFSLKSTVYSLTNEAITGIRVLWILNVFAGFGLDFNFGSSELSGGSAGTVTASSGGSEVFRADSILSSSGIQVSPTLAMLRYLMGLSFDVGPGSLYAGAQVASSQAYSLNVGARFSF